MSSPPDPTFTHGSKAEIAIATVADPETVVDISERSNSTGLPLERDKAEVSTFKSVFKRYVAGLIDGALPVEGPYDPYLDGVLYALLRSSVPTKFRFRPIGTGTDKPEFIGYFMVTKYEVKSEVNGASTYSGELQIDGDVPRTLQV